jgi:hypothetical protein
MFIMEGVYAEGFRKIDLHNIASANVNRVVHQIFRYPASEFRKSHPRALLSRSFHFPLQKWHLLESMVAMY